MGLTLAWLSLIFSCRTNRFSALDAKVRKSLRRWLRDLHRQMGLASIFVTHDPEEALEHYPDSAAPVENLHSKWNQEP